VGVECRLAFVSLKHVEHVCIVLVLLACHYAGYFQGPNVSGIPYPTDTIVHCAWFVLRKARCLRVDSLQCVCRSWVGVDGAIDYEVVVLRYVADTKNEAFRVSVCLSHLRKSEGREKLVRAVQTIAAI
jgi:hypothetical protein